MAKFQQITHFHKIVGTNIRKIRKSKKKSIEEVAFDAGIHFAYLGRIERGEVNPTLATIHKITDSLGISLKDIFSD